MSVDQLPLALRASVPDGIERDADWHDVLRRAAAAPGPRRMGARRGRVPGGLAIALVVVGGAAALGAPRLLAPTRVAPTVTTVERNLRGHLVGQRLVGIGFEARVIPGSTRLVTTIPLAGGGTAWLYAARTKRGLPCFATTGRPFGRSGCQLASDPRLLWARWGLWLNRERTVVGHAAPSATRSVTVVYSDGGRQDVRHVVDGWFLAVVRGGRPVPVALVARSADGRVLARTRVHVRFGPGHGPRPMLVRRPRHLHITRASRITPPIVGMPVGQRQILFVQEARRHGADCLTIRRRPGLRAALRCFGTVGPRGLGVALILKPPVGYLIGRIGGGVSRLSVRYADGDRSTALIGHGIFAVPLPAWRRRGPHRPVEVVAYDRAGKVVAARRIPPA